eukprot:CAMPEP_0181203280 /NCGR_PEP_ID=MMETSP1096-20121128/19298_1 /TAXON_ID=156174 ORGANISM="Chrysochromulina ericina, Strain CCMP281" /NCGR_SAMPLE_ID=MMETSP1096 /ASSEMBLY_ACC=CAM_ASM_000453 /LENGTH=173 /DNA_ID=CAMNT_0023293863 /DNA_START=138 /DNA_END=659 /DNA_ORIENTATION=-
MDQVMGGQLGIPHYSKVEACLLALAAAGAWSSILTGLQLLPVLGFTSGAAYMFICFFYAYFTHGSPMGPFLVMGFVFGLLACYRWVNYLDDPDDVAMATIFAEVMGGLTLLSAVVMKVRDTPDRQKFNQRFVEIVKWCEANEGFAWLPGKDAPEGCDVGPSGLAMLTFYGMML